MLTQTFKKYWGCSLIAHKKQLTETKTNFKMCTATLSSRSDACDERTKQQLTMPAPSNADASDGCTEEKKQEQLTKPPSSDDDNSGVMQFSFFIVLFFILLFPSLVPKGKKPTSSKKAAPSIRSKTSPKKLQWSCGATDRLNNESQVFKINHRQI
jgi:hypothetical protein